MFTLIRNGFQKFSNWQHLSLALILIVTNFATIMLVSAAPLAVDSQKSHLYTISPGFWKKGEAVRLARDLTRRNQTSAATNTQLPISTSASTTSTAKTFTPTADATVKASMHSTNFGKSQQLRIGNSPIIRSYLLWDLQGLT